MQHVFAGVPKRRMAQIMSKANSLNQISVCAHGQRDPFGDLRDLQGVGEASAEEIAFVHAKHLRFPL
jgi:hypothetical protein